MPTVHVDLPRTRRAVRRCRAVAVVLGSIIACTPGVRAIEITVLNDTTQTAYFRFGGATIPQGTYPDTVSGTSLIGAAGSLSSNPNVQFAIKPDSQLTGINLTAITAGKLLVSLGDSFTVGYTKNASGYDAFSPNFQNGSGPDATIRWDKVELTVQGGSFDSGNLSSTDFFSLRLNAETFKNGNLVGGPLTWRTGDTTSVFSALGATTLTRPDAVLTGGNGLTVPGLGKVLRVIAPSTASPVAYPSLQPYIDYVATNHIPTTVKGQFFGTPASTYNFTATICDGTSPGCTKGSAMLVGQISSDPGHTHTIIVPPVDGNGRSLAYQLYLLDFKYTVDGGPVRNVGANDAFTAATRDFLSGFSFGLVGSTMIDPRTGVAFKDESTDYWYDDAALHLPRRLTVAEVFSHAAPQTGFFNAYAAEISGVSDSYGFPFTDVLGKPLLSLAPGQVDQLVVTIMPDNAGSVDPVSLLASLPVADYLVSEPSSAALWFSSLAMLGMIVRRKLPRATNI